MVDAMDIGGEETKQVSKIKIDWDALTVTLPLFGTGVTLPVSAIHSVSYTPVEGEFACLRVNLVSPGLVTTNRAQKTDTPFPHPEANFLKEIVFKSSNKRQQGEAFAPSAELADAYRDIEVMKKEHRKKQAEERDKQATTKQDKLIKLSKNVPALAKLCMRPKLVSNKKLIGTLEGHANGLLYTTTRGDELHICYDKIEHAFFQPCEKEPFALLHFHFRQPLLFGTKKVQDVQFYAEVGEASVDTSKYHHMMDSDDHQRDIMAQEEKQKRDNNFRTFCNRVHDLSGGDVSFEVPDDFLKFSGSVGRAMVGLKPTASCLVQLIDWPAFLAPLDQVEWVHFERVSQIRGSSGFDMVLIYKDHTKKPTQIGQIRFSSLDTIKQWLQGSGLPHSEGVAALNWNLIMKTVISDPESFEEDGGWKGILGDDEDSDNEEDDSGSDYKSGEEEKSDDEDISLPSDDSDSEDED